MLQKLIAQALPVGVVAAGLASALLVSGGCNPSPSSETAQKTEAPIPSQRRQSIARDSVVERVTYRKPVAPQQAENRQLVNEQFFLGMLSGNPQQLADGLRAASENWDVSYVPMLLEVGRFLRVRERAQVMGLVESKTGQRFGNDFDKWLQWSWKQKFAVHPGYANFKLAIYSRIDPRFAEYFVAADNPKIRLDEIRWGGVRRDGIPPLKDPLMVAADDADYLADSDVVFGIELNGDARAYPKRILAWHEMFKDTIGGESVCGVY